MHLFTTKHCFEAMGELYKFHTSIYQRQGELDWWGFQLTKEYTSVAGTVGWCNVAHAKCAPGHRRIDHVTYEQLYTVTLARELHSKTGASMLITIPWTYHAETGAIEYIKRSGQSEILVEKLPRLSERCQGLPELYRSVSRLRPNELSFQSETSLGLWDKLFVSRKKRELIKTLRITL